MIDTFHFLRFPIFVFSSLALAAGCTNDSRVGALPDGALPGDAAEIDSGSAPDAATPEDARTPVVDGDMPDTGAADSGVGSDGGPACSPSCGPSSCGSRACGRSSCGYPCGECLPDEHCFAGGTCMPGVGPGEPCIGAFGGQTWEGDEGFRVCPTDSALIQRATCSGGGPDAWFSSEPCVERCIDGVLGARCQKDADCGDAPCDLITGRCGEHCTAGAATCAPGTACFVPGAVQGTCLTECTACGGGGCPQGQVCRSDFMGGFVCVPKESAFADCP